MSELDTLAHELRTMANKLRRVLLNDGVCYMETLDTLYLSMEDMREAADTIESLRDRLQDADVAYNDIEVLGDVTQGLFRDLMAADPDTAKLWARSWPELFGGKAVKR